MMYDLDTNIVPNDWTSENAIIKVVGVGGGGLLCAIPMRRPCRPARCR